MRTFIASVVCGVVLFAYFVLGAVFLGWKNGGGFIPLMIFGVILLTVWSAIKGTEPKHTK
jgi:fatty acid desaturase